MVDMAHFAGLVAAKVHPDPVPFADVCTMTVHKTLGGARGGAILCRAGLAEQIDAAVYPGEQGCPLPHVIAAKAVTFKLAGTDAFRERMERTLAGARIMAELLVAAEDRTGAAVVTGGTDVHQMLVDLAPGGREAGAVLRGLNRIGFSANAITLAYDRLAAPACSGLRSGLRRSPPEASAREQFAEVGGLLADSLAQGGEDADGSLAGAWPSSRLRTRCTATWPEPAAVQLGRCSARVTRVVSKLWSSPAESGAILEAVTK